MVILLKQHAPQAEQERLLAWLRELGAEVRVTGTPERPFFCLTGDVSRIDPSLAARFPAVEDHMMPCAIGKHFYCKTFHTLAFCNILLN